LANNRYRRMYNNLLQYGSQDGATAGVAGAAFLDNKMGYVPPKAPSLYDQTGDYADYKYPG
jgi:hypothetical protein